VTEHPWLRYRAAVVTGLLRDIRNDLDAAGRRNVKLAARVQASYLLYDGCEFARWIEEGLVREFLFAMRTPEPGGPDWLAGGQFNLRAYLEAFEDELAGLPRETRDLMFRPDVAAAICLDCSDTCLCKPEELVHVADWTKSHGFQRLEMHESNAVVMDPGKVEALRRCAGLA
jgi:hypothetical protein